MPNTHISWGPLREKVGVGFELPRKTTDVVPIVRNNEVEVAVEIAA
jgi:hypothetical protein